MTHKRFQVLALDGGGIKGVFSAALLAALEDDLEITITNHFDLIVGTSTGGIIALGLGLGLSPKNILSMYTDRGEEIFPQSFYNVVKQVICSKYDSTPLENILRSKDVFGERKLAESKKRLVIPAYNLGSQNVHLFKTRHHERFLRDHKLEAWKIALATSAAPTYFPAFYLDDNTRLIDGGVWANNPTLVGFTEAVSILGMDMGSVHICSISTSTELKKYKQNLDKGGFFQYRKKAPEIIMESQSKGINAQASLLLGDQLLRIEPIVPEDQFKLDKVRSKNELLALAANKSRHISNQFKEQFVSHFADEFIPIRVA